MEVIKRNGQRQSVSYDKITARIIKLCKGDELKHKLIDPSLITQMTVNSIYDGITTERIDHISATIAHQLSFTHYKYNEIAGRILISNHHKKTKNSFTNVMIDISDMLDEEFMKMIYAYGNLYDAMIDYDRDYNLNYFGFKTLENTYLIRKLERPQHLYMRVAVALHKDDIENVKLTYELLSQGYFIHATPTLYNAGLKTAQYSSCFLLGTEDNLDTIFKTLKDAAMISKAAGGLGIHISNLRAKGSLIKSTNGKAKGIIPLCRLYNDMAIYVDQGGRRNGAISLYIEPWHADVLDFIELKKPSGAETERARDIFTALWIPDLFIKRLKHDINVIKNGLQIDDDCYWSLMCPYECPGLVDKYGEEFDELYISYERDKKYRKRIRLTDFAKIIATAQLESGVPYILYKDHVNKKSNQMNIGTIKSSNLCVEIMEYSDSKEYAVCNLASVSLSKFVENGEYNYNKLYEVVRHITYNLNKIIDINHYPVEETKLSNLKHRPIAIGCQGLANVFMELNIQFTSDKAMDINKKIFETIYYAALFESCELAKVHGPYTSFIGSTFSKGLLQFDLWDIDKTQYNFMWDWDKLKFDITTYGTRNSLLTSLMPTASTSHILGNYESFEPIMQNIYIHPTSAGEHYVVNKYLYDDLFKLGLLNNEIINNIKINNGSIQNIIGLSDDIKEKYKTIYELDIKKIIKMCADRAIFIDQSQSMNIYIANPTISHIVSAWVYAWDCGLKTGSYYTKTKTFVKGTNYSILKHQLEKNKINSSSTISTSSSTISTSSSIMQPNQSSYYECEACQ